MSQTITKTTTSNASANVHFVVAGTQRSGTTLIQTTLESHPQIFCEGELFRMKHLMKKIPPKSWNEPGYHWWLGKRIDRWALHTMVRSISVKYYLDWFMEHYSQPVLGFKLMWNQTQRFPGTLPYILDKKFHVLHVRRRNVFRSLVSRYAANARGQHHSTEAVKTPKVVLPTHNLLSQLDRITADNTNWENIKNKLPYLQIDYDDYTANPEEKNRGMLEFLGVSANISIQSPLVKVTPNDLRKVIANFDEITKVLKGTEYEAMLET